MGIANSQSAPLFGGAEIEVNHEAPEHAGVTRVDLVIFGLVGAAAAVSWLKVVPAVKGIDVLAVAAVLGGGYPVFREAMENLLARRMTMELSMTIALAAALAIREFTTALFILFFVLGAEILEDLTVDRGRRAIRDLLSLLPKRALVRRGGRVEEMPISEVRAGDVVVIRPAAEIPVDGVVILGHSTVDQPASPENRSRPRKLRALPFSPARPTMPEPWKSGRTA
jgi:Cu+-exporting ATPase